MTNEMKYLMHLYACAATAVSASPAEDPVDFEALYTLADQMSLLSMLSYALKISPHTGCPETIKSRLYGVMLGSSLKNKMRMESLLTLLRDIEKQGIKTVVVKGLDCARFYAKPECRISADTDLYVNEDEEDALLAYFEQHGYTVHRRKPQQHHSECFSPQTGMIEVHTKMCEDYIFGAMNKRVKGIEHGVDRSVTVSVNDGAIRVLNPTDSMMFMTLHVAKHFMFGCASLKMAYDIALYYTNNADRVDVRAYTEWLRESGYETIVSALFSAMVRYCGFPDGAFDAVARYDEQKGELFAENLERYNSAESENEMDTLLLLQYYTTQGNTQKNGRFYAFLFNAKNVIIEKGGLLFPKRSHLEKTYPYLRKHPYWYPAACIHRFFDRGTKHVFHGDPKNGKVFGYRENMDARLSEREKYQIQTLKEMGLL